MQVKPKELRKVTEELGQPTAKDKKRAEVSALLQILYNQILLFFFFFLITMFAMCMRICWGEA